MNLDESKSTEDVIVPGQRIDGFERFAIYSVKDEVVGGGLSDEHAHLLACLHPQVQQRALEGFLSLEEIPSADQLCGMIEQLAVELGAHRFDKTECGTCRFNSSNHEMLFSNVIAPGLCVNKSCASLKAQSTVEGSRKAEKPSPDPELVIFREKLWRHALNRHLFLLPDDRRPLVALALQAHCAAQGKPINGLGDIAAAVTLAGLVDAAMKADPVQPADAFKQVLIKALESLGIAEVRELLATFGVDLGQHWVLTAGFFQKLAPEQAINLWREMGLDWSDDLQNAFEQGNQVGPVEDVLSQYDLSGFVPSCLAY